MEEFKHKTNRHVNLVIEVELVKFNFLNCIHHHDHYLALAVVDGQATLLKKVLLVHVAFHHDALQDEPLSTRAPWLEELQRNLKLSNHDKCNLILQ